MVSALIGQGLPDLLMAIENALGANRGVFRVRLAGEGLGNLHYLYEMGEVLARVEMPKQAGLERRPDEEAGQRGGRQRQPE